MSAKKKLAKIRARKCLSEKQCEILESLSEEALEKLFDTLWVDVLLLTHQQLIALREALEKGGMSAFEEELKTVRSEISRNALSLHEKIVNQALMNYFKVFSQAVIHVGRRKDDSSLVQARQFMVNLIQSIVLQLKLAEKKNRFSQKILRSQLQKCLLFVD